MIPLREYAEKINRSWEGILDEPENHPRLVVRPPFGFLKVWFMDVKQKLPDLVLNLSKYDCAPESLEFWREKARSGDEWELYFGGMIKREEFDPINSSWLLPLGFWDEIPQEIMEVQVRLKFAMNSSGICFTIRHIWVDTEHIIAQPIPDFAPPKYPVEEYRRMLFDLVREDWETHQWQYGLLGRFKQELNKIYKNKDDDRYRLINAIDPFYEFNKDNGGIQPVEEIHNTLQKIKNDLIDYGEVPPDAKVRHRRKKEARKKN